MTALGIVFAKGCMLGFSLAMIVGPIGILCIQQTLSAGFWYGIAVGLGAAVADGIYASLGGLGLSYITDFLVHQQFWLQLIGGAFLCYLGLRTFLSKPLEETSSTSTSSSLGKLFTSTIFLTLANPVTILTFSALIASLGITEHATGQLGYVVLLFCSVFLGSTLWWIILSGSLSMLRHKISLSSIHKINTIAGILMFCFGLLAIITVLL